MRNDGRYTYENKTFKTEDEATQFLGDHLANEYIDINDEARIEYVGGSEPYIITCVE